MAYDSNERFHERRGFGRPRADNAQRERFDQNDRYGRSNDDLPRGYDYGERDFFDRMGDEFRSWFGDEEAERRRRYDAMMDRRYEQRRHGGTLYGPGAAFGASYGTRPFGGYGTDDGFGMTKTGRQPPEYDYGPRYGSRDRYAEGYEAWRNRQMTEYDRDYEEFRRERQDEFDREFGQWREKRYRQRLAVGTVKEHQDVIGSDGEPVGTVDYIRGDRIVLTKSDPEAGGHHHSIPSSWVDEVGDQVKLNLTADEAHNRWRDIEQRKAMFDQDYESGPRTANRSFAETYSD